MYVVFLRDNVVFTPVGTLNETSPSSSTLTQQNKSTNIREFQQSIAQMDAEIARLSLICNDIHRNYNDINKNITTTQQTSNSTSTNSKYRRLLEYAQNIEDQHKSGQIDNIKAWELLSDIHNELNLTRQAMNQDNQLSSQKSHTTEDGDVTYSILDSNKNTLQR